MSFLKIGDRAAGAIKSGGTTRRAARWSYSISITPTSRSSSTGRLMEEQKVAELVSGSKLLKKHLNAIMRAIHGRAVAEERYDPTRNANLHKAVLEARARCCRKTTSLASCNWQGRGSRALMWRSSTPIGTRRPTTRSVGRTATTRCIPNEFMKAVETNGPWHLYWRTELEKAKKENRARRRRRRWRLATCGSKSRSPRGAAPDPGVQFDTTVNEWHTCPVDGRINASNPCVTGDTLVATSNGWVRIDSMLNREFEVLGSDGELHPIKPAFKTGEKPVYRLRTRAGYEVKLTADHKVLTANRGDVPACELRKDDAGPTGRRSAGSLPQECGLAWFIPIGFAIGRVPRFARRRWLLDG